MSGSIDSPQRHKGTKTKIGSSFSLWNFKDHLRIGTDRNVCPTQDQSDGLRSIPRRCSSHLTTSLHASPCLRASMASLFTVTGKAAQ